MSSSLPNHDAKDQKDRHKRDREKKKKNQGQTASLTQKYIENNNLYDA